MGTPPPRLPRRRLLLPLALAGAALACSVAGCVSTTSVGSSRVLQVALTEYRVNPQSVQATAGTLTIFVHNYGRLSHNLVISLDGHVNASTAPIPPGQTTELITDLGPGKYTMASTLLSDQALGAYGTLRVKS